MVDSRQKGARAESDAKNKLVAATKLNWQRVPGSGALDEKHGLKGDLYIPNEKNRYCVEVKHYKDDHLTSKILTGKSPQLIEWWKQTIRESKQVNRTPLLLFKFDRSKWFIAEYNDHGATCEHAIVIHRNECAEELYIYLLDDWLGVIDTERFII
jgi:hypothetical protein